MMDANRQIKELDQQRDVLLQLQKAASTASQLIFAVRELPRGSNASGTIEQLSKIKRQLQDDNSFKVASDTVAIGPEVVLQADALRQNILRLIEKSEIYLQQRGDKKARRLTFMRTELFSTVIAFQNLSETIVQLERSAKELEPATLASLQSKIEFALFLIIALAITLTLTFVYVFVIDLRRRLGIIAENLQSLALDRELKIVEASTDEIGELDIVLHDTESFVRNARRQKLVILDNSAEIICALDTRLKILSINPAVERLWHYEPDQLIGKSLVSLSKDVKDNFDTLRLRDNTGEFESDAICGDGIARIFAWSVSWSSDDHTFACIARDVTAVRQAERLRHNFISVLSHDLRTPITSLGVGLSLLKAGAKGALPPAVLPDLVKVETKVQGLTELITALLELDKLESGQLNLNFEVLHVYNIFAAARERVRDIASRGGITLDGPESDAFIEGDSKRLIDALSYLLRYSISRTPSGGVIKLAVDNKGSQVRISITDTGLAISLEERQLLFERYFAPSDLQGMDQLSNLSLCIARAIVQSHKGVLTLFSTDSFSTFCVTLPGVTGGVEPIDEEEDL